MVGFENHREVSAGVLTLSGNNSGLTGGITGGMKIARLAESFGMECAPHNWGEAYDHAVHFHCELAMPNNICSAGERQPSEGAPVCTSKPKP